MPSAFNVLQQTLYSDDVGLQRRRVEEEDPANLRAQDYLEASFAANIPSFPLSDPFLQANNYKDIIYLAIQHLMQAMSGCTFGLERQTQSRKGRVASGGARQTDQGYEPFLDHPLLDILQHPNPADTPADFVCQCVLNWNLHGRILIWARPNSLGVPVRYYCLPIPLCVPAFSIGSPKYPLGAWRIQQYYPTTGITGILPTGLAGSAGAYIDSREVYEMKNPHPVYRWAPYSHLVGADSAVDIRQMIDLSFHAIMAQGPKPSGYIDAPGADEKQIQQITNKIDNQLGGARKHGRTAVLGGGDPDRPALKWNPLASLVPDALHSEGWELYTSFVLAVFGLDMAAVGLRRSGGHAERWAARKDERETLNTFLKKLAATMTHGGLVKQWGLLKQGVRVTITLPDDVGYDPAEMSKDMAGDDTGTYNEVRYLRGLKGADGVMEEFGDMPVSIALQMAKKKLGLDDVTQEKELGEAQAEQDRKTMTEEQRNNPENNRPNTPDEAKGSLGGEGSGTPRTETKALVEVDRPTQQRLSPEFLAQLYPPSQETLQSVVARVLGSPVLLNGVDH